MQVIIPSFVEVKIKYQNDFEKCFLCGALCLSNFCQYHLDEENKKIILDIYLEEIEDFQLFLDELEKQNKNHSSLFIDYRE